MAQQLLGIGTSPNDNTGDTVRVGAIKTNENFTEVYERSAVMTATTGGTVPTPPNNTTTFLRGDGTFAASSGGGGITKAFYTGAVAATSGTTLIPADDTVPLTSEGTQLWTSSAITPDSSASKFKIDYVTMVDSNTSGRTVTFALFRGNTCVHAVATYISTSGATKNLTMVFVDSPATAAAVTYSVRVGLGDGAGRWYVSQGSTSNYGGKSNTTWAITEY